jgi:TPR repeat protein
MIMEEVGSDEYLNGLKAYQERDFVLAIKLWHPLASAGDARAQVGIAICLLYGSVGRGNLIKNDYPAAIEWLRKAVAQNDADAQFHLAQCYEKARGVSLNGALAIELYLRAAEHGHTLSQDTIARRYLFGKELPQSDSLAATWLRRAAESGLHQAQLTLARLYLSGKGVQKDVVLTKMLYTIGGRNADDPREPDRDLLDLRLSPEQSEELKALIADWKVGMALPIQSKTGQELESSGSSE